MCLASKSAVVRWYHKLRASNGDGIVGEHALGCWRDAKAVASFEYLAARGMVKIRAEFDDDPDASFYDTWPHLSERTRDALKAQYYETCEVVTTYARADIDDDWTLADSLGGCAGYRDSTDARQNAYVPGMMSAAVELWETLSIGQPLSI